MVERDGGEGMSWCLCFSGPSFESVERILRRLYGTDRVYVSEEQGLISCNGEIVEGHRVKKRGNRVNVEVAA